MFLHGGCTWTCKPSCAFSFSLAFLLIFYLELPLLLPRPQIKQLGTFFLYLTTLSAKIELFGQTSFSNLQQKLKYGMIQIRLLDHPSKIQSTSSYVHTLHSLGNMESLYHQSIAYLELSLPIMKYETYWYRYLTPPKVAFQALTKGGYNYLTCSISIHFALLGFEPLSPILRYSTSPLCVILTFLSRTVSSCNSLRYSGNISSIEAN